MLQCLDPIDKKKSSTVDMTTAYEFFNLPSYYLPIAYILVYNYYHHMPAIIFKFMMM